jgi:hypothetical protein
MTGQGVDRRRERERERERERLAKLSSWDYRHATPRQQDFDSFGEKHQADPSAETVFKCTVLMITLLSLGYCAGALEFKILGPGEFVVLKAGSSGPRVLLKYVWIGFVHD